MNRFSGFLVALALLIAPSAYAQTLSPPTLATPVSVANGGTACSAAAASCLDNIAGGMHTGSTNVVLSNSPTLVTPTLGVVNETSTTITQTAVNTANILSTGYSLTGSGSASLIDLSGTLNTSGSPDVFAMRITDTARGGSTTLMNIYAGSSATTSEMSLSRSGNLIVAGNLTAAGQIQIGTGLSLHWGSGGFMTSPSATTVISGNGASATPQTYTHQVGESARGGTDTNTAGGNGTLRAGSGTGNSTGATLTLSTPHTTTTGTGQQAYNAQITLGDNTVSMPNLASSSAATTGTVCWTTSTGNLTVDTTVACLASDVRLKKAIEPLDAGLAEVLRFKPISYELKNDDQRLGRQVGFSAQDVQKVDPRLVSLYAAGPDKGTPSGVRYMQLTAVLTKGEQELAARNAALEKRVAKLEADNAAILARLEKLELAATATEKLPVEIYKLHMSRYCTLQDDPLPAECAVLQFEGGTIPVTVH